MNRLLWLFLVLSVNSSLFAEDEESSKADIDRRIAGFTQMKNGGTGLLVGGIALEVIGPVLIATGVHLMKNDTVYLDITSDRLIPRGFGTFVAGITGTIVGVPVFVAGGVLMYFGNQKIKVYTSLRNSVSLRMYPDRIAFEYRF